jgi:phosphoglycolate phosphatase-like HAD superfamily hydrolase
MKPKPQTADSPAESGSPAILFDLDGTLADSNYQHVMAWQDAFREEGVTAPNARIHRRIGMSGRLLVGAVLVEAGHRPTAGKIERLEKVHNRNFARRLSSIRLLPGAHDLLQHLSKSQIRWAIASSGYRKPFWRLSGRSACLPAIPWLQEMTWNARNRIRMFFWQPQNASARP